MFWHRRSKTLPEEDEASPYEGGVAAETQAIRLRNPPQSSMNGTASALRPLSIDTTRDSLQNKEWEAFTESVATYGKGGIRSMPPVPAALPTYQWYSDENYMHATLWRDKALQVIH